jgi:hypothetical protein
VLLVAAERIGVLELEVGALDLPEVVGPLVVLEDLIAVELVHRSRLAQRLERTIRVFKESNPGGSMPSRRFLLAALAFACVSALLLPAAASAASTKVIVVYKLPAFHGKLKSPQRDCVGHRTVRLFKVSSGQDRILKTARSNADGRWATVVARNSAPAGTYYVKAVARGGCEAATSKRVVIPKQS